MIRSIPTWPRTTAREHELVEVDERSVDLTGNARPITGIAGKIKDRGLNMVVLERAEAAMPRVPILRGRCGCKPKCTMPAMHHPCIKVMRCPRDIAAPTNS